MGPAFTYTVADLALDEALRLPCACRTRTFTRAELLALIGGDARLHLIGPAPRGVVPRVRGAAADRTGRAGGDAAIAPPRTGPPPSDKI
jgi:hypothetical protein